MNPIPDGPPPAAAGFAYTHASNFHRAGEHLTFDVAVTESRSFPRSHLIYAQCDQGMMRFRFPLCLVEVTLRPDQFLLPRNLPTSVTLELLEQILRGEVSVLFGAAARPGREPQPFEVEVAAIGFPPLFATEERPEEKSK